VAQLQYLPLLTQTRNITHAHIIAYIPVVDRFFYQRLKRIKGRACISWFSGFSARPQNCCANENHDGRQEKHQHPVSRFSIEPTLDALHVEFSRHMAARFPSNMSSRP
jgi:hypothetical protein